GQEYRAGKPVAVVAQVSAGIAKSHLAAQPAQQPSEAMECFFEPASRGLQFLGQLVALAIEKQRVLDAGARKTAVVQSDDERMPAAGVTAGCHCRQMQTAFARTAAENLRLAGQRGEPFPDVEGGRLGTVPQAVLHVLDVEYESFVCVIVKLTY